jgi:hypothetical protein
MDTNISQKEQKDKLFSLRKEAFVSALLSARPQDYQERNWFYQILSWVLSYPLQLISILAGGYLLFDIARFVWHLEPYAFSTSAILGLCFLIFLGIETFRRWLVNTTGYHFLATFRIVDNQLVAGEWLKTKLYILAFISIALISSGTSGAYLYIKHNSPEAATLDVKTVASPITQKINQERNQLAQIDKSIQSLLQAKKTELADYKSYTVWQGKEYLLPDVKERHLNYDKQIAEMSRQRQSHQNLLTRFEDQLQHKEQKTEAENEKIIGQNQLSKESYAFISASIWLVFEILLVFMLSYPWIYKHGVKREILLQQIDWQKKYSRDNNLKVNQLSNIQGIDIPQLGQNIHFFENKFPRPATKPEKTKQNQIGFQKWYENRVKEDSVKSGENTQNTDNQIIESPKVVIKEVPVIKEVFIEKQVPIEVIQKEVENEGFVVVCSHCGKSEVKKRPAKYCSDACRNKAWKGKNQLQSA